MEQDSEECCPRGTASTAERVSRRTPSFKVLAVSKKKAKQDFAPEEAASDLSI